jgi:hypothetical protein
VLYGDAVARVAARYDAHGFCPWIFDDPRWRAAEGAVESAFAGRRLGQVQEAIAAFETTAIQIIDETCAIVSAGRVA